MAILLNNSRAGELRQAQSSQLGVGAAEDWAWQGILCFFRKFQKAGERAWRRLLGPLKRFNICSFQHLT